MDGLEVEFEGRAEVYRLNAGVPPNERIQFGYGVRGHPSVVILDADGAVTHRFFGAEPAETLRAALNEAVE